MCNNCIHYFESYILHLQIYNLILYIQFNSNEIYITTFLNLHSKIRYYHVYNEMIHII